MDAEAIAPVVDDSEDGKAGSGADQRKIGFSGSLCYPDTHSGDRSYSDVCMGLPPCSLKEFALATTSAFHEEIDALAQGWDIHSRDVKQFDRDGSEEHLLKAFSFESLQKTARRAHRRCLVRSLVSEKPGGDETEETSVFAKCAQLEAEIAACEARIKRKEERAQALDAQQNGVAGCAPIQDMLGYIDALVEDANDVDYGNEADSGVTGAQEDATLLSKPACLAEVRGKEVGIYNRLLLVVEKTIHDHKRLQAAISEEKAKSREKGRHAIAEVAPLDALGALP